MFGFGKSHKNESNSAEAQAAAAKILASADENTSDRERAIPAPLGSPTGLLVGRLNAWKHIVNDLISFYEDAAKVHKATASSYEKIATKGINVPIRDATVFDAPANGPGPATLMATLQQRTTNLATEYTALEQLIKQECLSQLEKLKADIKAKQRDYDNTYGKDEKSVEKTRGETAKLIEALATSASVAETSKAKIEAKRDPYLLRRQTFHSLHKQTDEENGFHQQRLALQDDVINFEVTIINTIRDIIAGFDSRIVQRETLQVQQWSTEILAATTAAAANPRKEWLSFSRRETSRLADPQEPKRVASSLKFAGMDAHSALPIKEGFLQRKSKILGKSDTHYYVLTPSGWLHEFKSNDTTKDVEPSLSMYVPEALLGAHTAGIVDEKGKTNRFTLSCKTGAFNTRHEYTFTADSKGGCIEWWEALRSKVGQPTAEEIDAANKAALNAASKEGSIATPPADVSKEESTPTPVTQAPAVVAGTEEPVIPSIKHVTGENENTNEHK